MAKAYDGGTNVEANMGPNKKRKKPVIYDEDAKRIKCERERLKKLKSEADGLSADVLDAINLLKDRGLLDREYDPRMHYLRWRRFPEFRIELYNFEEEFE